MRQIWSQDPPYEIAGEFWNVRLKTLHPRTRHRLYAEALPERRPADRHLAGQPAFIDGAYRGAQRLRHHLGQHHPDICGGVALGDLPQSVRGSSASGPRAKIGAWRAISWWRPSEAEAHDRVFGEQAANRYLFDYMRTVLSGVGQLAIMKPRPEMSDAEATVEAIIEGCMLYGSPKTMLDKLVAFREEVGPFGYAADDRRRLARSQRELGATIDATHGRAGDAAFSPACAGASRRVNDSATVHRERRRIVAMQCCGRCCIAAIRRACEVQLPDSNARRYWSPSP